MIFEKIFARLLARWNCRTMKPLYIFFAELSRKNHWNAKMAQRRAIQKKKGSTRRWSSKGQEHIGTRKSRPEKREANPGIGRSPSLDYTKLRILSKLHRVNGRPCATGRWPIRQTACERRGRTAKRTDRRFGYRAFFWPKARLPPRRSPLLAALNSRSPLPFRL